MSEFHLLISGLTVLLWLRCVGNKLVMLAYQSFTVQFNEHVLNSIYRAPQRVFPTSVAFRKESPWERAAPEMK